MTSTPRAPSVLIDPAGGAATYTVRHGWGYSVFEHTRGDLEHSLSVFVDRERSAKISRLTLTNRRSTPRKLRVYGVVDWVLGSVRARSRLSVATGWDRTASAIAVSWTRSFPSWTASRSLPETLVMPSSSNSSLTMTFPRRTCPKCSGRDLTRSRTRGASERLARLLNLYPFRCRACYHRFLSLGRG